MKIEKQMKASFSVIGKEGSTLSDAEITGQINWYYKNVEVK